MEQLINLQLSEDQLSTLLDYLEMCKYEEMVDMDEEQEKVFEKLQDAYSNEIVKNKHYGE